MRSALLAGDARTEDILQEAWVPAGYDPVTHEPLGPAEAFAQRRAYEEAIAELDVALARNPDHAPSLERRGALHASLGFLRAAELDFERAARQRPREPRLWLALGRVRVELDLPSVGLEALRRARALGLDSQELHVQLARGHRSLGRCEEALHHYVLAFERPPRPPAEVLVEAASLALGVAEDGDEEARARVELWLGQALERDPECPEAWVVHGIALDRWGGEGDPAEAYRRATELDPSNLEAWTQLALLCHEQGDRAGCDDAARRAIKLEKRDERRRVLAELIDEDESLRRRR